jgi:hypothetical protein
LEALRFSEGLPARPLPGLGTIARRKRSGAAPPSGRMRLPWEDILRLTFILLLGGILGIALGIGLPAAMGTLDDYTVRGVPVLHLDHGKATDGLRLEPVRLIGHL